jgi:hypothetical protein
MRDKPLSRSSSLFFAGAPIVLDIRQPRLEESLLHLDALASGKTSWARFGRTLRICYLSPGATRAGKKFADAEELRSVIARTAHLLPLALQSMKNIHRVECVLQFSPRTHSGSLLSLAGKSRQRIMLSQGMPSLRSSKTSKTARINHR